MISTKITGTARIFRNFHDNEKGGWYSYSTGLSRKTKDGAYESAPLEVNFRRGCAPTIWTQGPGYEYVDIDIIDGFLGFRTYQDAQGAKHTVYTAVVMEYAAAAA